MLQADLGRPADGSAGPIRLTARVPALERLAPLWPSVPREVTGSATVELESPDAGFGTYQGRLGLQVATAELLGGRLSLRDVSADVPVRRGGAAPPAGGGGRTVQGGRARGLRSRPVRRLGARAGRRQAADR